MMKMNLILAGLTFLSLSALASPSAPAIRNFHEVDPHVYRGGQPTTGGFHYLARLGVKTVVDLRQSGERSSQEAALVDALGMHYVNVPMSGLTPPTEEQITQILALLENRSTGAVFVHCLRGADRTGTVIAAYRIDYDHWDNARALHEARELGMAFFQLPRQHYIRTFQPLTAPERAETAGALLHPSLVASSTASVSP